MKKATHNLIIDIGLTQKYPSLRGRFARSNPSEIFCEIASPKSGLAMTLVRKSYDNLKLIIPFLIPYTIYLFFFSSCRKEAGHPSWDVDVLAPLVKSTLTINNIIPDSLLQQNTDNSLDIVYQSSLYSFSVDSLFQIPTATIDTAYWLPFPIFLSQLSTIVPATTDETKNTQGGAELTDVILRSGTIEIMLRSQVKSMIDFTYKILSAKDPFGNVFNKTFRIPAATSATDGVYTATFDLSGYKLDLTGLSGNKVNTITSYYNAIISPAPFGDTVTIQPYDSVVISNKFIDIVPQYAKGYFGHTVSNIGPDSTNFSLFNHIIDGTLQLEDIDVGFSIENSIGADARVTIDTLSSINTRTGSTILLAHSIIGAPVNLNRAVDNNGNVTSSTYSISFNPSNSNIKQFVENLPNKISYLMDLEINPLGNVSGSNDFVYYDKLMKTQLNMAIPLSLIANNLTLADTLDFKMDKSAAHVNSGTLYLYAENGFPFTAEAQLYLMNDNFTIVDSLISAPNAILAPQLDANFICAGKRLTKLAIPLDEDKLQLLKNIKKMYIKMKYNTAGQPNYVKIYSFYEMNVKLVGDFNYTVGK
ncbi:MAG: hypothetical protein AABZ32_04490 [Bacteroidota bacterium]